MKKVLVVVANPKPEEHSVSRKAGSAFLKAYQEKYPNHEVKVLDLFENPIQGLDGDVLGAWGVLGGGGAFEDLTPAQQKKVAEHGQVTEEFMAADVYVFVNPLWNFTVPAELKQYVDAMMIAGKTFQYTEQGPQGMLENKKAVHIQAAGGFYSQGPAADLEMGHRYMKNILGFIGVSDVTPILIEGTNAGRTPEELAADIDQQVVKVAAAI